MGIAEKCQIPVFSGFTFKIFMIVKEAEDKNPDFMVLQYNGPIGPGEKIATYEDGEYHGSEKMEVIPSNIKTKIESSIEKLNNGGYKDAINSFFGSHRKIESDKVAELTK